MQIDSMIEQGEVLPEKEKQTLRTKSYLSRNFTQVKVEILYKILIMLKAQCSKTTPKSQFFPKLLK